MTEEYLLVSVIINDNPLLLCVYDLIHMSIFPEMIHVLSFSRSLSVYTLSNAICKSIHTESVCFYVEIHLLFSVLDMWFDLLRIDVL